MAMSVFGATMQDISSGPMIFRVTILSSLTVILSTLSSASMSNSDARFSCQETFKSIVKALISGGHLKSLLSCLEQYSYGKSSYNTNLLLDSTQNNDDFEFIYSIFSLFIEISQSNDDGSLYLLEHGILNILASLPSSIFPQIPYLSGRQRHTREMEIALEKLLQRRMQPILNLLCTFLHKHNTHKSLREVSVEILRTLRGPIESLLHLQLLSTDGLILTTHVLDFIVTISDSTGIKTDIEKWHIVDSVAELTNINIHRLLSILGIIYIILIKYY
jgi:hypothetical protein